MALTYVTGSHNNFTRPRGTWHDVQRMFPRSSSFPRARLREEKTDRLRQSSLYLGRNRKGKQVWLPIEPIFLQLQSSYENYTMQYEFFKRSSHTHPRAVIINFRERRCSLSKIAVITVFRFKLKLCVKLISQNHFSASLFAYFSLENHVWNVRYGVVGCILLIEIGNEVYYWRVHRLHNNA